MLRFKFLLLILSLLSFFVVVDYILFYRVSYVTIGGILLLWALAWLQDSICMSFLGAKPLRFLEARDFFNTAHALSFGHNTKSPKLYSFHQNGEMFHLFTSLRGKALCGSHEFLKSLDARATEAVIELAIARNPLDSFIKTFGQALQIFLMSIFVSKRSPSLALMFFTLLFPIITFIRFCTASFVDHDLVPQLEKYSERSDQILLEESPQIIFMSFFREPRPICAIFFAEI